MKHRGIRRKLLALLSTLLIAAMVIVPSAGVYAAAPTEVVLDQPADLTFFSGTALTLLAEPLTAADIRIQTGTGYWDGGIALNAAETWVPVTFQPAGAPPAPPGTQRWRLRIETFRVLAATGTIRITMRATNVGGTSLSNIVTTAAGALTPPVVTFASPANGAVLATFPTALVANANSPGSLLPADVEPFMSLQLIAGGPAMVPPVANGSFWDPIAGVWTAFEQLMAPGVSGTTPNFTITEPDPGAPGEVLPLPTTQGTFTAFAWAADAAGNLSAAGASTFTVGAVGVLPTSAVANPTIISEATVALPAPEFTVTVTYPVAMNTAPANNPVLSFDPNVVTGGTLVLAGGSWPDATHFVASYNVADVNATVPAVAVTISGGLTGGAAVPVTTTFPNRFSVATAAAPAGEVKFPTAVIPQRGTALNRVAANLRLDDGVTVQVRSLALLGTDTADWFGQFLIGAGGLAPTSLTVNYNGNQSAAVFQALSVYNWTARKWDLIDQRVVGAGLDATISWTTNTPASYMFGPTRVARVRVSAYSVGTTFTSNGDLMSITITR